MLVSLIWIMLLAPLRDNWSPLLPSILGIPNVWIKPVVLRAGLSFYLYPVWLSVQFMRKQVLLPAVIAVNFFCCRICSMPVLLLTSCPSSCILWQFHHINGSLILWDVTFHLDFQKYQLWGLSCNWLDLSEDRMFLSKRDFSSQNTCDSKTTDVIWQWHRGSGHPVQGLL